MQKSIIKVPGKLHLDNYRNQIQSQFPSSSFILDKKLTGCGATTMILRDEWPTILCSPLSELVHCKATDPEFLGLVHPFRKSDDRNSEVFDLQNQMMDYIRKIDLGNPITGKVPKILVTYDSFRNAAQRLYQEGMLDRFSASLPMPHSKEM